VSTSACDDVDQDDAGDGDDQDGNGDGSDAIYQGIQQIDDIGEQPSGARVSFVADSVTGAPESHGDDDGTPDKPPTYTRLDPAQSDVASVPPWHQQGPGQTPAPRTTPFTQVWD
jgi:hypothetical protein